jgi:O-succinylbenzoic acid--CoA ligase
VENMVAFLKSWFDNNDYIEVLTSGSTGKPKIIKLQKQSMMNSASMTCRYFNLNEESSALLCLPADYIAGKMMIVRAFVSGFNLLAVKPSSDPFQNLNAIIDFTAITPFQFINSYQSLQETPVKKIIVGGSQVSLHLQKLMESLKVEIYETYGMTETCSHVALRKLNGNNASEYFEILQDIEISHDQRNCLLIKAPLLTSEQLVTNDVVEIIDMQHFKWLGRFDNVINSGGVKIFPEQVEKKIEPFIDNRFFIGTLPDKELNQKVVLLIEGQPLDQVQEEILNQQMSSVLGRYEKPRQILYLPAFEVSSSGKILKSKILSSLEKKII